MQAVAEWQKFFADFTRLALAPESPPVPALDAKDAGQFFSQFNTLYVPFVQSGGAVNVWEVAGIGTDEVRNSAILCWLLDCYGSHGQGDAFLRCFLEAVDRDSLDAACRERFPQALHVHAPYRTVSESAYGQEGPDGAIPNSRVDIVVESASFLLFIEVKVHAGETGNQLERYSSILRSKAGERPHALIFLTPDGRTARNESAGSIVCLSWKQLADAFEMRIATAIAASAQSLWTAPVQQFCRHIRTL